MKTNRWVVGLGVVSMLVSCWVSSAVVVQAADITAQEADIDWRQFSGTSLTVLSTEEPYQKGLRALFSEFEKLTGMKVKMDVIPWTARESIINTELATKADTYDVIQDILNEVALHGSQGWLEPLEKHIGDRTITDPDYLNLDGLFPKILGTGQYKGTQYAIPFFYASQILYYRLDVFEGAGITPPDTFDELAIAAEKIHSDKVAALSLRSKPEIFEAVFQWLIFLRGFGGAPFADYPNGDMHPTLDSDQAIYAAEYYANLLQNYAQTEYGIIDWSQNEQSFKAGNTSMIIEGVSAAATMQDPQKSTVAGKIGYALAPKGPAGRTPPFMSQSWVIPWGSKSKKAAWLLIQWMTSFDTRKRISLGYGDVAVTRTALLDDPEYLEKLDFYDGGEMSYLTAFKKNTAFGNSYWWPAIPEWSQIGGLLAKAINLVIIKEKDAEMALREVNENARAILKKAGYFK